MIVVQRQAQLFHVVAALRAAGRFTRLLDRGQQQGDQDRNDRDHHQQLNERKSPWMSRPPVERCRLRHG
jgi:hypothetical protein